MCVVGVPLEPLFAIDGVSDFPPALCNCHSPVLPDNHCTDSSAAAGSSLSIHIDRPSPKYHTYVYENSAESDIVDDLSQSRSDSDNDSSEFKDQCDDFMDQCEGDKSPNGFPTDINVSDTTILNNCTAEVELNPPIANVNSTQTVKRQNRRIAARNQNASKFARCRSRVTDKYKRVRSVMELLDTNIPHNIRKPKSVGELKSFVVLCSNLASSVILTNPAATNVLTFLDETMAELNNPVRE